MNIEKLNELLPNPEFVDYQHPNGPTDFYDDSRMFEYANTIIKECINIFEPPKVDDIKWSYDKAMLCMDIQDKIRQYFGLEDD